MKRLVVMSLLLMLALAAVSGCAATRNDTAEQPQPQGEMRPTGEGGWENPNI